MSVVAMGPLSLELRIAYLKNYCYFTPQIQLTS